MQVEAWLDRYFVARGWQIKRTTPHEERRLCLGDRIFIKGSQRLFIEYKSGLQTHTTGNVFLETISVDSAGKPGWVYTCQAHYIMYACLLDHKILIFVPQSLRDVIEELKYQFPVKPTGNQNKGYKTHGVVVPLVYAEEHLARKILTI